MHFFLTLLFCSIYLLILYIFIDIIGAMKDNINVLQRGVLVLLPEPDDGGRSIIYFNPSLKRGDDDDKVFVSCF